MKRLRICHVIHNTQYGGAETMLLQILKGLRSSEVDSAVISLMDCGPTGEQIRSQGVPVFPLGCVHAGIPRPLRLVGLARRIRALRPDLVQTWTYHADLLGGMAAKLAVRAPIVWNVRHATLDPTLDSANTLRSARLCGRLSRRIPKKILLNAHAAIPVHVRVGYDETRMQVIPNGFDTQRFQPCSAASARLRSRLGLPADTRFVGMAGRVHMNKGQEDFFRAAGIIAAQDPSVHFVLAGQDCDPKHGLLGAWIAKHELTGRAHLLGGVNDMPQFHAALDAYLLPSLTEGLPNVVGEAMACAVPCVVTDVGDAQRLVGNTGVVVAPGDHRAMAAAVLRILQLPSAEATAIGQRARQRILDEFNIDTIAPRYLELWRDLVDRSTTAPRPAIAGSISTPPASVRAKPKLVHVTTVPMTQWFFLRGQNQFMHAGGFDVHAVSSPDLYLPKLQQRDPVTTHAVPISRQITPWKDFKSVIELWRCFRSLRPDIVQLSTPKAALLGAIAAHAARVPVRIYQIRGLSSESESGTKRWLFQRLEMLTARLCNGSLVNATSLLGYARQTRILRADEGHVAGQGMSNGVELTRFDPAHVPPADLRRWDNRWTKDDGPVIGFVGRLTRDKGVEELYAAWRRVRDEFPRSRLLLVGPWESENAVDPACYNGLRQDPRVILAGMQDDIAPFYRAMDLFVFGSHGTEGFPNAPMEAAAMALPVVATRVVGCVDAVVHDVTGKLIAPQSPEAMEAAIRDYLQDEELRHRHGRAGQSRIREGFAPPDLWADFHAFYVQHLAARGLPLPIPADDQTRLPKAA